MFALWTFTNIKCIYFYTIHGITHAIRVAGYLYMRVCRNMHDRIYHFLCVCSVLFFRCISFTITFNYSRIWFLKNKTFTPFMKRKVFLRTASSSFMYLKECKYCNYYYCTLHFILEHTDLYFHWIKNIKDRNARSCWIIWKVFANLERRFFPC